jgi:hypothetical protein
MDIVVAADGTSVVRFCGHSVKLEVCTAKIIIPSHLGNPGPQQAAFLGIPLFMHDGDECYQSLNVTMGRMFRDGHLREQVTVSTNGQTHVIKVQWHLCADLKLMLLLCGFGGACSRRPCFLCLWDRNNPDVAATMRTADEGVHFASWASELFQPIQQADSTSKLARKTLKAAQQNLHKGLSAKVVGGKMVCIDIQGNNSILQFTPAQSLIK